MTLAITVDLPVWLQSQIKVLNDFNQSNELIAVIKSNGYGLGQENLARAASHHGLQRIAIGTIFELESVASDFAAEIVVLEPINPLDIAAFKAWQQAYKADRDGRLIGTLADLVSADLVSAIMPGLAVVLEIRSEMNRFGSAIADWRKLSLEVKNNLQIKGLTIHSATKPNLRLLNQTADFLSQNLDFFSNEIAVSHVSATEFKALQERYPGLKFRIRIGTKFWLNQRSALKVTGTVLAKQIKAENQTAGYQNKPLKTDLIVVSGGTAHGVGLAAPASNRDLRTRFTFLALAALGAIGRSLSPFQVAGQKLWFFEPPHQQVSLLKVKNADDFKIGQEIELEVRFTTTHADVIRGLDF